MRPEVGIVHEGTPTRRIVPDVAVARPRSSPDVSAGVAVLGSARKSVSKSLKVAVHNEPLRHPFVEIRDPTRGHQLITLIEIVSPSNKRPGIDRKMYARKQREVLDSDANLIEIDLLRGGDRLIPNLELEGLIDKLEPRPDYLVLVNRSWHRVDDPMAYEIFAVQITESLPCIAVPLRREEQEVPLDLQFVFSRAYDRGPYRRGAVDYGAPPYPELEGEQVAWAEKLLGR
jgi:hypothetical protein